MARSSKYSPPGAPDHARSLLKDRAYRELKHLIQSGVFAANSFLSERQLSERLGMSKTPIRAALEHLEAQGLVAVSPQQGIVVRDLAPSEIRDLFDARFAIEPFVVAKLAAWEPRDDDFQLLDDLLHRQQIAAREENATSATELDIEFHRTVAELQGNLEIVHWLERCFDKLHRSVLEVNRRAKGRMTESVAEHSKIVSLIRHQDGVGAAESMRIHLDYGRQFLLNVRR